MSNNKKLRCITYLSPDIPVETFEAFVQYIEQITGCETYLIYESRSKGPPEDKVDPFTSDEVDIAFMESTAYLRLLENKNQHIELCGAGPVYVHSKNVGKPVYYTDIVINSRNSLKYKELHDLRGHSLGFSSPKSLSASITVLDQLKKLGVDASFFGNSYESGSHIASIRGVLESRVDVAAVDSVTLAGFLRAYPNFNEDLQVISSLGPLPIYPIVLNSRLPDGLKTQISSGFLDITKTLQWTRRLADLGISGFAPIDNTLYNLETELRSAIGNLTMASTYY